MAYSEKLLLASPLIHPGSAPGNVIQEVGGGVHIRLSNGVAVLALVCSCKPAFQCAEGLLLLQSKLLGAMLVCIVQRICCTCPSETLHMCKLKRQMVTSTSCMLCGADSLSRSSTQMNGHCSQCACLGALLQTCIASKTCM